jgi:hypothetical protein
VHIIDSKNIRYFRMLCGQPRSVDPSRDSVAVTAYAATLYVENGSRIFQRFEGTEVSASEPRLGSEPQDLAEKSLAAR